MPGVTLTDGWRGSDRRCKKNKVLARIHTDLTEKETFSQR